MDEIPEPAAGSRKAWNSRGLWHFVDATVKACGAPEWLPNFSQWY
jgi:hypothetical protein